MLVCANAGSLETCEWVRSGRTLDLTSPVEPLGSGGRYANSLWRPAGILLLTVFARRQAADLILGQGALARTGGLCCSEARSTPPQERCGLLKTDEGWNGFNVLHTAAARVGGLDLGFVPGPGGRDTAGILAGAEGGEIESRLPAWRRRSSDGERLGKAFVVYQGHHGDAGAHRADVVLPGAAYTEKDGIYVNTEGRVQQAPAAIFPLGEAREDWKIIRALSDRLGRTAPPTTRSPSCGVRSSPSSRILPGSTRSSPAAWGSFGREGALDPEPFRSPIKNSLHDATRSPGPRRLWPNARESTAGPRTEGPAPMAEFWTSYGLPRRHRHLYRRDRAGCCWGGCLPYATSSAR